MPAGLFAAWQSFHHGGTFGFLLAGDSLLTAVTVARVISFRRLALVNASSRRVSTVALSWCLASVGSDAVTFLTNGTPEGAATHSLYVAAVVLLLGGELTGLRLWPLAFVNVVAATCGLLHPPIAALMLIVSLAIDVPLFARAVRTASRLSDPAGK
jgi:hypothetical protein